ncbi:MULTISPECIES: pyridoxal phosphate-dependent decarboxylase family protein [Sediminimonas]|uniref:pyridoxal phosphate-dependent decarboxylase family protein n=1 Tax=Sediminimonas TaxID=659427 RepID=UPI0004001870|nr:MULTISPECIES: pyridoxal-dependent decarboxylase [Sediminimonas]MDR9485660.1 pyridoxal-dependent decarboxylase [Sediminimonas sp.]
MRWQDFPKWGKWAANWAARYHAGLRDKPVRARTTPGAILNALPASPPDTPQPMDDIIADFETIVMPGMTHWQHPRFFAYFPSNAAPAAVLADNLITAMAPQCMLWQTSPAATEMETRMMDWLRQAVALPGTFQGVIQDSASTATLAAVLVMRERALNWHGNAEGLSGQPQLRVYASSETHSSVDRAIWISGIGQANLVRIPTKGPTRGMDISALEGAIAADKAAGRLPAGIIACTGGTGTGACDDVAGICAVARRHDLFTHVDAAWAGSAMICPEFRTLWAGVEEADSVVFNPHKWLGTQFDLSAHFLRAPDDLTRTLAIQPEYLKTHGADGVINYSEWSIPLGRRFRALKLWFLIRAHGLSGLRQMIRNHVGWSRDLAERLRTAPGFEIVTEPILSLFTFRYAPKGTDADAMTQALLTRLNDDGHIYVTQTRVDGHYVIRFQIGQFDCTAEDVDIAFDTIIQTAKSLEDQ